MFEVDKKLMQKGRFSNLKYQQFRAEIVRQ